MGDDGHPPAGKPPRSSRRQMLVLAGSGLTVGLAGCVSPPTASVDHPPLPEGTGSVAPASLDDVELPVDRSELRRGADRDSIPAIVDPVFGDDWAGVSAEVPGRVPSAAGLQIKTIEPRLEDDDLVVGVARSGSARAYPLRVLTWHEIVNDEFGGPLLVTYCPLCRSALAAERRADGEVTRFGVSGLLYRSDLVLYDEATDSLWSQILATAIDGPLTGQRLNLVPFTLTTLGEWRESHPETQILRPPPESGTISDARSTRDYTRNPYAAYEFTGRTGLDGRLEDDRLHPKTEVLGVAHDSVARAYTVERIEREGLIEDSVAGLPVVVTTTPGDTPIAWVREIDGEVLSFSLVADRYLRGGRSRWHRATGVAVDGPYEGRRLTQANAVSPLFWFAWLEFHPETDLYQNAT